MRQASAVTQCTTANVHSAGRQRVTRELVIGPRFYADPLGLTPPYKTCRKSSPVHPTVRNALSYQESSRGLRLETPKSPGRRKTCTTQVGGLGARKVRGRLRFYVAPKQQPPCSLQRSGICNATQRRGCRRLASPGLGAFRSQDNCGIPGRPPDRRRFGGLLLPGQAAQRLPLDNGRDRKRTSSITRYWPSNRSP